MLLLIFLILAGLARAVEDVSPDECFDEAATKYITCKAVHGRPSHCDCTEEFPCYIKFILTLVNKTFYINQTSDLLEQGPTITAKQFGIIILDVFNEMDVDTSIHFHGMRQRNVHWIDGVGNVTQYPIPPKGRFRYIFRAEPQGTHWYHSHVRFQRDSGLFGMLIVFERKSDIHEKLGDFIDQPERKTLALPIIRKTNNENEMENALAKQFCLPDGSNVPTPFTGKVSFQINGKSISPRVAHTRASSESHTQFYVVPGKRYRFRVLGASSSDLFIMSIDHHKMIIIATDGYLVEPFTTDYLIVHVAERYDFILEAKKDAPIRSIYPIRIKTLVVECNDVTKVAGEGFAYLVYTNRSAQMRPFRYGTHLIEQPDRCSNKSNPCEVFNCPFKIMPDHFSKYGTYMECYNILSLKLLYPSTYYHIPDSVEKENEFFFNYHSLAPQTDLINGIKFVLPTKPILESDDIENECKYPVSCTAPGAKMCTHTVYLNNFTHATRFVYSSLIPGRQKGTNVTHPIHMHGHSYFIAKIGYPEYYPNGTIKAPNTDLDIPNCGHANWRDGTPSGICVSNTTVRKDTVIVPAGGYVAIHFFQNDPGWWFMHCHIDNHLNGGMAIAVGENHYRASTPPEPLFTDTNNFCFTLQEFLDKEFSLRLSHKVEPIPSQICQDSTSRSQFPPPREFQKGKIPPPSFPPRFHPPWHFPRSFPPPSQLDDEDTYTL